VEGEILEDPWLKYERDKKPRRVGKKKRCSRVEIRR
jgi:hypothetical protein